MYDHQALHGEQLVETPHCLLTLLNIVMCHNVTQCHTHTHNVSVALSHGVSRAQNGEQLVEAH